MGSKKEPTFVKNTWESIEVLLKALKSFDRIPIKKLVNDEESRKELVKEINDSKEKAHSLAIQIEDLRDNLKRDKVETNNRFASKIVDNFLRRTQ